VTSPQSRQSPGISTPWRQNRFKVADNTVGERLQDAGLIPPPEGKSMGAEDWADAPTAAAGCGVHLGARNLAIRATR